MTSQMLGHLKCTVVSLYPFPIRDRIPSVNFEINLPGSKDGEPQVQHVPFTTASRYILDGQTIAIPIMPNELAQAIVFDFCSNQLCYTADTGPGLFWVNGEHTAADIKNKFAPQLEECKKRQLQWFALLVKCADDDWTRNPQHRMISDLQRIGAHALGLDREWLLNPEQLGRVVSCPACTNKVNEKAVVCPHCQCVLDPVKYSTLQFANRPHVVSAAPVPAAKAS